MTYAGNLANTLDFADDPRYRFVKGDICDEERVGFALRDGVDAIVNFAAESHVDRSILNANAFLHTNVLGVHNLLEGARASGVRRFLQVSTDEVYGEVSTGSSRETDVLAPRSPYSASKASAELLTFAHASTFGLSVVVTRGANTYGPRQYPEKLIPLFTTNLIDDRPVPLYGDGQQVRDWLHVDDHARGILCVLERGADSSLYNLGGDNYRTNRDVAMRLVELCGRSAQTHVRHVTDRRGHDRRYSMNSAKTHALGWTPHEDFERGLERTVRWYQDNESWWRRLRNEPEYADYYTRQYAAG
jgi:dTDP-glucose 4,6-dehydratase